MKSDPIWVPSETRIATSGIAAFGRFIHAREGAKIRNGDALSRWAAQDPARFWDALWDHFHIIGDKGTIPFLAGDDMLSARFFPQARLNLAENLLGGCAHRSLGDDALVFWGEDKVKLRWSWAELRAQMSRLQQALVDAGIRPGDRVAGLLPNRPEAIAAMLAATSIGAIWCSASPDFGVRAVLDRFAQIEPKVLFGVDGYWYAGKRIDIAQRLVDIAQHLPSVTQTVVVDYLAQASELAPRLHNGVTYADFIGRFEPIPLTFERLPFDHPAYILFSSGTTGAPKCIVHRAGGVLLQHVKEQGLHADVKPGDRLFYYTTLGWMMWNWMVSGLARGATLMLFDGSPFHPGPGALFDYADAEGITHFGTSAKYIGTLRAHGYQPRRTHDLKSIRAILSTGSPLTAENFDYVYNSVKADVHLASISGGTDIASCFVAGDPTAPVYRGELQRAGFGMTIDVWTDDGRPTAPGTKGELVCTAPFPSMPLGFWNDSNGRRYRDAYFDRFPGVWCQGDFAERTQAEGFVIHGRSDATLNPGGVRIGTAEIYAEVEKFQQVRESVVIGQDMGDDVRVVLFVVMIPGVELTAALVKEIKDAIRVGSSPRHVPNLILQVDAIPHTKTGKVSELAVRDIIHRRIVKNLDSLANPEALECYRNISALRLPD